MRVFALSLLLSSIAALPTRADDTAACLARGVQLGQRAQSFGGEPKMKRLIDADLKRAKKEAAEGDADECSEALDHATKLLDGGAA